MKKTYDVLVIGPVSLDHNIDYQGNERKEVGGAVVASGFAAAKSGNRTAVFTKLNPADADVEERFAGSGADVYWKPSQATCSIRNQYFTADKEKRACTSMGVCDPFRFDELPDIETKIYHFAGLVYGDFDGALFAEAASTSRADTAPRIVTGARRVLTTIRRQMPIRCWMSSRAWLSHGPIARQASGALHSLLVAEGRVIGR